jgi:Cu/Ag efflux pump CusA
MAIRLTSLATCSSKRSEDVGFPLRLVADIRETTGPNVINRENTQRRIVIGANTRERDLGSIVANLRLRWKRKSNFPAGYYFSFEGEFQAQQEAARRITFSPRSCSW